MRNGLHKRELYELGLSAFLLLPLFAATYYAAFLLRFAGEPNSRAWEIYLATVWWIALIKLAAFVWFRLRLSWARYVDFHDVWTLFKAATCGQLVVMLFDTMCIPGSTIPRSIIVIDWGSTLLAVAAFRALPQLWRSGNWQWFISSGGTPALIAGANDSGEILLRAIRYNRALNYRVVGFVDDRAELQQSRIGGIPVIGTCAEVARLVASHGIKEVLITSGELPGRQVRSLVETGRELGFRVTVLPSYKQLLEGRVAVQPRPVAIEDLLGRSSVELDLQPVRDWLAGRVVMVTGSAGSIGSEICRQLLRLEPAELVIVDRAETGQFYLQRELTERAAEQNSHVVIHTRLTDLTDRDRLNSVLGETRPEIIFHAAAYKHVPLMETHCAEAVKNIVLATRNLVDLAEQHGARALVMISTDKAVNPTSVMGSCKRLAEQYVQARSEQSSCRLVTVRFGNVLDSSGSVVPIFRQQIGRGGPVTVTHPEITRYFMLIPEAAQLVIQSGAMGKGGEIFVLDMGEPVCILDLAHDMIRLSGLRVGDDIEVQIVGLRPGEKLYEELYDASELRMPTTHPKIMVADSARRAMLEVISDIGRLESLLNEPNEVILAALRDIVPACEPGIASRRQAA
jgi:FlaA1/EpsC-like NDP-sugar epimerase